jgi:hypothetical protein
MPIVSWAIEGNDENDPLQPKAKWFPARYSGGEKSCCGDPIEEGEDIRADGDSGWEGRCCEDVDPRAKKKDICPICFVDNAQVPCFCVTLDEGNR